MKTTVKLTNRLSQKSNLGKIMTISGCLVLGTLPVIAQSNLKEGNNNFALYTKSQNFANLDAARKFADAAYQTKRDSVSFRNILLRGLVYSTLAVVDSNRAQAYTKDPADIGLSSLRRLSNKSARSEHEPEINYIKRSLANAYLIKANRAVAAANFEEAYLNFHKVDSISGSTIDVKHNLAVLSAKIGGNEDAIKRYQSFTSQRETSSPTYILQLAKLYRKQGDNRSSLNTLLMGREQFPKDKEILFTLINTYLTNEAYAAIVPLADEAITHEPENVNLNYIAGYANEMEGNNAAAKAFYEKVINLDANNFEGNLELGLMYLREYIAHPEDEEKQNNAQDYLLRANQIKPSEVRALKSLAVLYDQSGDIIQKERVNSILNQLTQ